MQALILAGGFGTRLQPLTLNTPKPVVPIGNRPFLLWQIERLKAAGITKIILSLNYQPEAIESVLGDGSEFGVELKYLIEPQPLGTAGAYKFAEEHLSETTIVLNGDIFTDISLRSVIEHHQNRRARATIVLVGVENPQAYGLVETDADSKILRFLEKPTAAEIKALNLNTINAGIYILEPQILEYIPAMEMYSFEYQLFPQLLAADERFFAFTAHDIYWLDIGTHQRYMQAHRDLMSGQVEDFRGARTAVSSWVKTGRADTQSIVADGVLIEPKAKIINSVLGQNVYVGEGAIIEDSVIWAETKIEAGAKISGSIIGAHCQIGRSVVINNGSVIGGKTIIADCI